MFEALREADAHLEAAESHRLALLHEPEPKAPEAPVAEETEAAESVGEAPFIEVGPNRTVEASPGILDQRPVKPALTAACPTDQEPILAPPDDDLPRILPAPAVRPMTFSFRPTTPAEKPNSRQRLAPELIAHHRPEHPTSARYAELLASVTAAGAPERTPALLFTSALGGAGTTTVVLNLAIIAAGQGRRVVVVDANLARPGIAARLAIEHRPGVFEVLRGATTLDDGIQETAPVNLFALTAGSYQIEGRPRLVAGTIRSLVRDLRRRFDLVLIDGPRWDGQPEVVAAAVACDAVYVVTPEADAESPQTDQLVQAIPKQGARLGGCVLTAAVA
jgi:Mrp family chromosome partitioning ATPase